MRFGEVIPVFPKRVIDFDEIASATEVDALLASEIPVVDLGMVVLQVRVHSNGITGLATITIALEHTAPSDEEPDQDFVATAPAASVTIDASTAAGTLLIAFVSPGVGSCLRLKATGLRATLSEDANAQVSVDIVGRRGVPPGARKLYTYTHHFYTKTDTGALAYVPWATSTESTTQNAPDTYSLAPYSGRLVRVVLLSTLTLSTTTVSVYRGTGGLPGSTAIETVSRSIAANTAREYVFTDSTFTKEDTMQLSVTPGAATHGEVYIAATWEWDPET